VVARAGVGDLRFTEAYEATHRTEFLSTAEKTANYLIDHLPPDAISLLGLRCARPAERSAGYLGRCPSRIRAA
jgi:hypothetical protein